MVNYRSIRAHDAEQGVDVDRRKALLNVAREQIQGKGHLVERPNGQTVLSVV
jgi:hypothetical protein